MVIRLGTGIVGRTGPVYWILRSYKDKVLKLEMVKRLGTGT